MSIPSASAFWSLIALVASHGIRYILSSPAVNPPTQYWPVAPWWSTALCWTVLIACAVHFLTIMWWLRQFDCSQPTVDHGRNNLSTTPHATADLPAPTFPSPQVDCVVLPYGFTAVAGPQMDDAAPGLPSPAASLTELPVFEVRSSSPARYSATVANPRAYRHRTKSPGPGPSQELSPERSERARKRKGKTNKSMSRDTLSRLEAPQVVKSPST
ncbi:hypothetical protein BC835DRAFT_405856 [Cytidiella melzeri]|nr:hypothetical protein BC835DRAFT_405856 [Cytidiella melzeri]